MKVRSRFIQVHIYRSGARGVIEYLLLFRSPREELYPGMWQTVTGLIEEGENAVDAADREVREETGIRVDSLTVVPHVASFYNPREDAVEMIPVFAARTSPDRQVFLSDEHTAFDWLPFESAFERLVMPSHRQGLSILHDILTGGEKIGHFPVVRPLRTSH